MIVTITPEDQVRIEMRCGRCGRTADRLHRHAVLRVLLCVECLAEVTELCEPDRQHHVGDQDDPVERE